MGRFAVRRQSSVDRRSLRPWFVALSYLVLACLVYWPVSPLSRHQIVGCACSDPAQEVWFLHWTSFTLLHGHSPFFTTFLHAPHGANLALNTTAPLLGVLGMPVTVTLGPVATYNLLLRLALAASAGSMYFVLRRYTSWWPAAYAGGLLFGFSPYMIGHAHRHLFLIFLPLLPLFIPVLDDWIVRVRGNPWRGGLLIGLLTAGEFLISPEVVFLIVAMAAIGLVVLALRYPRAVVSRLLPLGKGLLVGVPVLAVLIGYPVHVMTAGAQRPVGSLHPNLLTFYQFQGDLAAPFVPTSGEFFTRSGWGTLFTRGSVVENGLYLGIPLLVLLVVAVVRHVRSGLVLSAAVVGVVAFVVALGPTVKFNGSVLSSQTPFNSVARVSLLENLEPARLSLFMQVAAAILLAVVLDGVRTGRAPRAGEHAPSRWRTALATVLAVVALLPLVPRLPLLSVPLRVPALFTSVQVDRIPQGARAMTIPYSRTPYDAPMLWQSASGMRFKIFGGDAFAPDDNGFSTWRPRPPVNPNINLLLLAGQPQHPQSPLNYPTLPGKVQRWMRKYRVQVVLVDPKFRYAAVDEVVITEALGVPSTRMGGMDVWLDVPALLRTAPPAGS